MCSSDLPGFIIYFGNANGSYTKELIDFCSNAGYVHNGLLLADFNNDNVTDVALLYPTNRTIIVFFICKWFIWRGKSSFLGEGFTANPIAVSDFNEDQILDIVITYNHAPALGLLFGYANGTFGARTRLIYIYGELLSRGPPILDDFNRYGHLDIVISTFPVTLPFLWRWKWIVWNVYYNTNRNVYSRCSDEYCQFKYHSTVNRYHHYF